MKSNISFKLALILGVLLSTMTTSSFAANPLRGNPFLKSPINFSDHGGNGDSDQDQDCDKDQDKDCDHNQDKDCDKDKDKGQGQDQDKCDTSDKMRVDCRYHNDKDDDKHGGPKFCYASAIYTPETDKEHGTVEYNDVQLGVGCDRQTIYNNSARVHTETVGERISPPTAAFPGVELFPQGALLKTGTYESVLDIRSGRLNGVCYVHPVKH